jgi:protein-tyrosine-phosphatase
MGNTTIITRSAGIRTTQASRSPAEAVSAAATYGIQLATHVPQQLTRQMMDDFDLVVVMEAAQYTQLRLSYPTHRDRIFLLAVLDHAAEGTYEHYNIVDPFGQPLEAFHTCYRRISRSLDRLITLLHHS